MANRNTLKFGGRKKNHLLGICVGLTVLGAGITVGLLGGHIYLASSINKNTADIESIAQSTEDLKTQVQQVKEQQQESIDELTAVEDSLARYQPVVIPDSMK